MISKLMYFLIIYLFCLFFCIGIFYWYYLKIKFFVLIFFDYKLEIFGISILLDMVIYM